ncbi:hypothetical protein BD410DRAFT_453586 [Rickenella mellea]|uniref:F-box domain-containing protein n=1 Tax=Rickenella mellea TaxID=50990 RepID=A0A4Y7PVF9_9AGAM|nr:hypothetical protein BD410DRAFT_453586 [Rickenella mellea]
MDRVSFDDVLGTNYAPLDNGRRSIKTLVQSMEELSSLNQVLSPSPARCDKLHDSISAHKALLTRAQLLPPELLSEIFTHSSLSESSGSGRAGILLLPHPRVSGSPLKLGRICRRWHQIALSTPSLWSAITIPKNWNIEGLQEWIRRAGSVTISFSVDVHQQKREVLRLLASHQSQWKEVVMHLDTSQAGRQLSREFLETLSRSYGNLQTLDIRLAHPDWGWKQPRNGNTDIELTLGIDSAPHLRSLSFHAPDFKMVTLNTLPLLCLREIRVDFDPVPVEEFLTLLRLSPTVEVVDAYLLPQHDSNDSSHEIATLLNLKDLEISEEYVGDSEGHYLCLLEKLASPALERLCYSIADCWEWIQQDMPTHVPHIKPFIHRSRPPLRELRIQGYCIPAADIIYCIQFLPNLACIHIYDVAMSDDWDEVIQLLTGPIPPSDENLSGCMCALLNEIHFGQGNIVSPDSVINMILSRSPVGNQKLSCVTMLSCSEHDVLTHPKIMDCVANGLKFRGSDTDPWGGGGSWVS